MKDLRCLNDLRPYGLDVLTGEACRVMGSGRILCDADEPMQKTICDLLGLCWSPGLFYEAYNHGGPWRSFMLPSSIHTELMAWTLLNNGCSKVMIVTSTETQQCGGVHGFQPGDDPKQWDRLLESFRAFGATIRVLSYMDHPGEGTRNRHAMSGRVV